MIDDRPSRTARFVAAARALGALLPDDAQLVQDPYGARVAPAAVGGVAALARRAPALRPLLRAAALPMLPMVAYLQVRTRLIDDVVDRFVAGGGRQLVLLGAGFDARAARLPSLAEARVFEVDHPATQALKRARFGETHATYVAWDFLHDDMQALGARLGALGHDAAQPTLTVWEAVTMYLTEPAIAATVAAVHGWSARGSRLCFTYLDKDSIERPPLMTRVIATTVRRWGEPWRFGWRPAELPAWLAAHRFRLVADYDVADAALRRLPRRYATLLRTGDRYVAVAEPA